jgi:hypothetical protein
MADPTNPTDLPDPATLQKIQQIFSHIVELAKQLPGIAKSGSGIFDNVGASAQKSERQVRDLLNGANEFFDKIVKGSREAGHALADFSIKNIGDELLAAAKIDKTLLASSLHGAFDAMLTEARVGTDKMNRLISANRINLADALVFNLTSSAMSSLLSPITDLESKITDKVKGIAPSIMNLGGTGDRAGMGRGAFDEQVEEALAGSARAARELGVSTDVTNRALNTLTSAGVAAYEVFGNLNQQVADSDTHLNGLAASLTLSSATGLEMDKIAEYTQQSIRQLGRAATDTGAMFAALSLAQRGTGLSMSSVSDEVMGSASSLRYYGTSVESLANTFNAFTTSVGKNKQLLGKELFKDTITQIENMSFGMRAFLGMQSQVGKGRGAIDAGLEVEQALAEGRTGEIFTAIREQLERVGGGQVLTRQQALDTNQGSQYLLQRQLLQSMLGPMDAGKADTTLGILQRGEVERATEVFAKPQDIETRRQQLLESGQHRIEMETGAVQGEINKMRAREAEGIGKMVSAYGEATASLKDIASSLLKHVEPVFRMAYDATAGIKGRSKEAEYATSDMLKNPLMLDTAPSLETIREQGSLVPFTQDIANAPSIAPTIGDIAGAPNITPTTREVANAMSPFTQLSDTYSNNNLSIDAGTLNTIRDYLLQQSQQQIDIRAPNIPAPTAPITEQPAVLQQAATTNGPTALQFEAQELKIPISFKIDGDSIKAVISTVNKDLIVQIKKSIII